MQISQLELCGEWDLFGHDPSTGRTITLKGMVPGHVHRDLLREGIIPDPFWRDQANECQWVEEWEWRYRREFWLDEETFDIDGAEIEFGGLDTFATIEINGTVVGSTENMFIPHSFAVGHLLRPGANEVEVRLAPLAEGLRDKPVGKYTAAFCNDRVLVRRMQCTFHWDWVNRFVSPGIWRSVTLHAGKRAAVRNLYVYTESLTPARADLSISFDTEIECGARVTAMVTLTDEEGHMVWSEEVQDLSIKVSLRNPRLWWPNGYGSRPLYTCTVRLIDEAGREIDSADTTFGVRTVELEEIPDAEGSSFTLRVNGERIFAKGSNWVPADPFPGGLEPERYERLISLAAEGNINVLRLWGGGIYEQEAFWEACDRHGVMVTADFMLACGQYPEDNPEFMAEISREFECAVRMLRNHPSLVLWSGDNELGLGAKPTDEYPGKKLSSEVTGPLCARLDPSRPFRATSPFGGDANNSPHAGDCHISAWYQPELYRTDMSDYRKRIEECRGRFVSEYAISGAPPMRSLRKFMTDEDIADPEGTMWEFHTKDNPFSEVGMSHYRMLERTAECLFGPISDIREKVSRMEYVQYEWLRLAIESARRDKYHCSGFMSWMYNDCWPASGWSVVDYYTFPKAGYYAMKSRFAPVIASIQDAGDEYRIWVCNDTLSLADGRVTLRLSSSHGVLAESTFSVRANESSVVMSLRKPERSEVMLVCDLVSSCGSDRAFFYPDMPFRMDLPKTELGVSCEPSRGELRISSERYARVVCLDADLYFSDNYFDMLPGEEKVVTFSAPEGGDLPHIEVSAWNSSGAVTVRAGRTLVHAVTGI